MDTTAGETPEINDTSQSQSPPPSLVQTGNKHKTTQREFSVQPLTNEVLNLQQANYLPDSAHTHLRPTIPPLLAKVVHTYIHCQIHSL